LSSENEGRGEKARPILTMWLRAGLAGFFESPRQRLIIKLTAARK